MPDRGYTLWGTPHSLFTGKVRSYLLKSGVSYRERLASDPRFLSEIVPQVGHMVIPVIETPDGALIQDSTAIIDHVEARAADPLMDRIGPVQQVVAHFLDAFGSNYLMPAAMHYRWSYRAEQEQFLRAEFARAVPPVMPYDQRLAAAGAIMDKFNGFLPNLGVTSDTIPAIEAAYEELLDALEAHFRIHPYLLGGRPSLADFGMIAPLYAHLGRDPVPARLMRTRAPNVARWTERMNVAAIADCEYPDHQAEDRAGDTVPETLIAVLRVAFSQWDAGIAADAACFEEWLAGQEGAPAGAVVSLDGKRRVHPHTGKIAYEWRGITMRRASHVHSLWHLARARDAAQALNDVDAARLDELLTRTGGITIMNLQTSRRMLRKENVLVLA